jgi:protoheme IX farnesyltransferase
MIRSLNLNTIAWRDYLELCKPRVVMLMLLTVLVGMFLATPNMVPIRILFFGCLGIGLLSCAGAAINHLVDRHLDALMNRTQYRPIAAGRITVKQALIFTAILSGLGLIVLITFVNTLTAILTLLALIGYAGIYTFYLKRATPQNIVIGGAAGAAPPLLGWCAVTGYFVPQSLLLVLIIFVWTPPHFWALAIHRYKEYSKAKVPMLPVTHGIPFTKLCILLYTILLFAVSLLPYAVNMSGIIYFIGAFILGGIFIYLAARLFKSNDEKIPLQLFHYSIYYLMLLFCFLLVDHYIFY